MTLQLHRPQIAIRIVTDGVELPVQQRLFELRIHTVAAAIAFVNLGRFIARAVSAAPGKTPSKTGYSSYGYCRFF